MGNLFGKARSKGELNEDEYFRVVLDLKRCRDNLMKYQNRLEGEKERLINKAREYVAAGNLEKAKILLKTKKIKEGILTRSYEMLSNVETQIADVENKKLEIEYIKRLSSGNDLLKELNDAVPLEEVERVMDENEEQAERINEINEIRRETAEIEEIIPTQSPRIHDNAITPPRKSPFKDSPMRNSPLMKSSSYTPLK